MNVRKLSFLIEPKNLILKDAFEKGKALSNSDHALADDLERAIADGDFGKLKTLINTNTRIVGDALSHEIDQARFIGDYLGGGEFSFLPSKRGVEGFLEQGTNQIPISLKEYVTDNVKNVFRRVKDNGKLIVDESLVDSRVIVGGNPNTISFCRRY